MDDASAPSQFQLEDSFLNEEDDDYASDHYDHYYNDLDYGDDADSYDLPPYNFEDDDISLTANEKAMIQETAIDSFHRILCIFQLSNCPVDIFGTMADREQNRRSEVYHFLSVAVVVCYYTRIPRP